MVFQSLKLRHRLLVRHYTHCRRVWQQGEGQGENKKVGNKKLRNLVLLGSFNACQHMKACRKLFERIVNQGKSKKLALITAAIKLIKQCFAIAKSARP
jgi:transposase